VKPLELWPIARGAPNPPPRLTELAAGNATRLLDGGDIRYYRVGGPLSPPACAAAPPLLELGPYAVALIEAAAG
jgi:hypothetical protein